MTQKKPAKRTKNDYIPHTHSGQAVHCQWQGCDAPGEYKAPKSKDSLGEYQWYCLEHIREYNSQWDFFEGMSASEIEEFRHEANFGHRPTWGREGRVADSYSKLHDAVYDFLSMGAAKPAPQSPQIPPKIRRALALFDLEYPFTVGNLKAQYRIQVKKFHPDVNKNDKEAEEQFKRVTDAYRLLADHVKNL